MNKKNIWSRVKNITKEKGGPSWAAGTEIEDGPHFSRFVNSEKTSGSLPRLALSLAFAQSCVAGGQWGSGFGGSGGDGLSGFFFRPIFRRTFIGKPS